VIETLWKVNRLASAILLSRRYELVAQNHASVTSALNSAQTMVMKMSREDVIEWVKIYLPEKLSVWEPFLRTLEERPYADLYYWSGFYMNGDL
jgi:CHAT domain-containing protein